MGSVHAGPPGKMGRVRGQSASNGAAAPLRPLGAGELLDGAVRLVRRNLPAVLIVSIPYAIARTAVGALTQYATISSDNAATVGAILGLLIALGFGVVLTGLLAPLFSSDLLGMPISARASLARVGWRAVPLVVLGVVIPLAEGAGVFAFGIVSVWLWGVWAVAAPAFALERLGVVAALGRSFRLVDGAFWRTWGLRALGWVLTTVLSVFLTAPFEALAAYITGSNPLDTSSQAINQPGLYVVILSIGGLLSAALLAPVAAAVDVLLYTDLRMRKEGLDIVLGLPPVPVGAGYPR